MAKDSKSRLKPFYLYKILHEETDAEHGLNMAEILQRLKDLGIPAERKSIYTDIDLLNEVLKNTGYHIEKKTGAPMTYALIRDVFSFSELTLMVDAIQSCRAITNNQSNQLVKSIKTLANKKERKALSRTVHVIGRVKSKSREVFKTLDLIHEAKRGHRRQICFNYYKIDWQGNRTITNNGNAYEVTPVSVAYDDGFYYLTSWSDERESFMEFRLDRMGEVFVSDKKATLNDAIKQRRSQGTAYATFGRFGGEETHINLLVEKDKTEIIRDRFEENLTFYEYKNDPSLVVVSVKVCVSEQFFGWIASMGNLVRIAPEQEVHRRYKEYLQTLLNA